MRRTRDDPQPFFLTVMTKAPHTEVRGAGAAHNPRPALRHRGVTDDDPLTRLRSFNEQDLSDKPSTVQSIARLDREARQAQRGKSNDRRGTLLAVDDLVQRVVRALRESGQLRDTLVIFTSDNGYLLGEHRLRGKNQVDTATRVRLMMRGPGVPAGMKVGAPVANLDVPATIYDVADTEPLVEQDGVSLYGPIDQPGGSADRELLIETTRATGIRTAEFLYAEYSQPAGAIELYDLETDPYQLESVHDDPAYLDERVALAARLAALQDCEGSECH